MITAIYLLVAEFGAASIYNYWAPEHLAWIHQAIDELPPWSLCGGPPPVLPEYLSYECTNDA